MNVEKMKKWLDLTNEYQKNDFWTKILNHYSPDQFFEKEKNFPIYDVYQSETHICIILELPGVNPSDIHISLQSKMLLAVKGIARPLFPAEMDVKKERFYGNFERLINLPVPADAQAIQVNFHQGLIQITYPRQNESIPF